MANAICIEKAVLFPMHGYSGLQEEALGSRQKVETPEDTEIGRGIQLFPTGAAAHRTMELRTAVETT